MSCCHANSGVFHQLNLGTGEKTGVHDNVVVSNRPKEIDCLTIKQQYLGFVSSRHGRITVHFRLLQQVLCTINNRVVMCHSWS